MTEKFINLKNVAPITLSADFKGWIDDNSLPRFIVDTVDQLNTSALEKRYNSSGSKAFPPKMMLALIFYCYVSGIFSSRKIEKASYELIPVIFITHGLHPDHSVIAKFRKKFLEEVEGIFLQILQIAAEMGVLKLGDVSIDGTKIKANASKHKAMSYAYAQKLEEKLKEEIATLLAKAAEADNESNINEIDIPGEVERQEVRLAKIGSIKVEIEARRKERYEQDKKAHENKLAERARKEQESGRKLRGKQAAAPDETPKPSDQMNLTDGESRIMPVSGGGFEQAYNAQASVDMSTMIIVGNHLTQNTNDKKELEPALETLTSLPQELGQVSRVAADNGCKSEANIVLSESQGVELYVPAGRQKHNEKLEELLAEEPSRPENPTPSESLKYRMKTKAGKAFYAMRKSTVEPVFGIIKSAMGFRSFSYRGLELVSGEWNLVCLAYNLKRLCALKMKTT